MSRGFSLSELVVCIGVVGVLLALVLAMVGRARTSAQSAQCVSNLHAIVVAFGQYAADNQSYLPNPAALQKSWETCLRKYLTGERVFRCAADEEVFPIVGSSYDWRDTGRGDTTLSGRLLSDVNRGGVVLTFESLPGWHQKEQMNAAFLDGSARAADQEECLGDLRLPVRDSGGGPPR